MANAEEVAGDLSPVMSDRRGVLAEQCLAILGMFQGEYDSSASMFLLSSCSSFLFSFLSFFFLILEVLLKYLTFSDSIRHQSRNAPVGSAQNEESSIISGPRRKLA